MDPPPIVEDWLAQRRALGQDRYDEVWEGEYHVAPAPHWRHARVEDEIAAVLRPSASHAGLSGGSACNIGAPDDYRVPDRAYLRAGTGGMWNPTAAIVVEVVSPDDESRRKLGFCFRAGVREVLLVDPDRHTAKWLVRGDDRFEPADGSILLGVSGSDLAAAIDWPA